MGMMKREKIETEIRLEEVEAGIKHLKKWAKKSFKDHTGEWVEVRTSGQLHLFSDEIEPIAHSIERV